jgi:hypothetical protein
MRELSAAEKAAYFQRSYTAVDGLWFMKLEAETDLATALKIDTDVWTVMPKIQARWLKQTLSAAGGLAGLRDCLATKFKMEDFGFRTRWHPDKKGLTVTITRCPWYEMIKKSNRQHIGGAVGQAICAVEYTAWAEEFGPGLVFALDGLMCQGTPACRLRFTRTT